MACRRFGDNPLSEPMVIYCQSNPLGSYFNEVLFEIQFQENAFEDVVCKNGGLFVSALTHWGRATHICVSNLTIIASDNGLSPIWRQAIIWTNAGILLIGPLAINFSEI